MLARSSNIGTIELAQQLGQGLDSWLRRFGPGQPTGLDFPDEANGIMRDVDDWSATSIGAIPIGQENAVNAVQMLGAFNTSPTAASTSRRRSSGHGRRRRRAPRRRGPERVVSPDTADR